MPFAFLSSSSSMDFAFTFFSGWNAHHWRSSFVTTEASRLGFLPAMSGSAYGAPSLIQAVSLAMMSAESLGLPSGMCGSLT
jgi:hypothetical protein